jgi:hypothetical protein
VLAADDWTALGGPGREHYGLTVTGKGEHVIWHDHPGGPLMEALTRCRPSAAKGGW